MVVHYSTSRIRNRVYLGSGSEFTIKDHRGFTVFTVNASGDVKKKGRSGKL